VAPVASAVAAISASNFSIGFVISLDAKDRLAFNAVIEDNISRN
jgi:hypothetical protein